MSVPSSGPGPSAGSRTSNPLSRIPWRRVGLVLLTTTGLLYLAAILSGMLPPDRRFGFVEVILLAIIVFANSRLAGQVDKIVVGASGVELGLRKEIQELATTQQDQQAQIKVLHFLLKSFLPQKELDFLWGLTDKRPITITHNTPAFQAQIYHLLVLGFIASRRDDRSYLDVSAGEDLQDNYYITEAGRRYLKHVESIDRLVEGKSVNDDRW